MPLPLGFVPPCLPTKAPQPPTGEAWLHEIKHDGFRVVARKDGTRIKLYRRPGNDLTYRFTLIVEALSRLRSRSCIIDGEAVCCDDNGMPSFDRIRYRRHDASVFLYAFDLIELDGDDLRREPFETRKATLASLLKRAAPGLRLNEHIEADGPDVFAHACKMGLEGIVSKRKTSPYRSGRSPDWIKSKNPACEAVRREAEEDWGDVSICQGVRIVSAIVVVRIQRNENREWCRGHGHGNFATNDGYCYAWRQSGTNTRMR
jgi:bifunctional non-homologous end joining protein LigD